GADGSAGRLQVRRWSQAGRVRFRFSPPTSSGGPAAEPEVRAAARPPRVPDHCGTIRMTYRGKRKECSTCPLVPATVEDDAKTYLELHVDFPDCWDGRPGVSSPATRASSTRGTSGGSLTSWRGASVTGSELSSGARYS